MLEIILDITDMILGKARTLSLKDKNFVRDQVSYAIRQTSFHINGTRSHNKDKASAQLSNIWQRVGLQIRSIDNVEIQNLAETMEAKSKYWADPANYSKELLAAYKMKLVQIQHAIDSL